MLETRFSIILMIFFLILIGISSNCFLQPIKEIKREFYVLGYDAPALRLGKSIKGELWRWDVKTKKWEAIGDGIIPAGTYLKFKAPKKNIEDLLKEEK